MLKYLTGQLPPWAQPQHPILQYQLRTKQIDTRSARLMRALGVVIVLLVLIGGGYLYATNFLQNPAGSNLTDGIWRVLFFPTLIIQVILRIAVFSIGVGSVAIDRRNQTWDNLRATEKGAEITLRTRWAAMFYRMRDPIAGVLILRLILIAGILYDLTAFRGGYLDMLTANITPEVPVVIGILLLSALMTAGLLLPLTGLGIDMALGLLVSTMIRQRTYAALVQAILILVRVGIVVGMLYGVTQFIQGEWQLADWQAWGLVGGFAALGDWGLILMQLGSAGEIWAIIPYGVLFGVTLLVFALLQAIVTDMILSWAIRIAERRE